MQTSDKTGASKQLTIFPYCLASSEARRQRRGVYPEGINHPPLLVFKGYMFYIVYKYI